MRAIRQAPSRCSECANPVMHDGPNAGIAGEHFVDAPCGRIGLIGGANVGIKECPDFRQVCGKLLDQLDRLLLGVQSFVAISLNKPVFLDDLFHQLPQRSIERVADEIVDAFVLQLSRTQSIGKDAAQTWSMMSPRARRDGSFTGRPSR